MALGREAARAAGTLTTGIERVHAMSDTVNLHPIPALRDNYVWAMWRGEAALVVDPGDATPVQQWLAGAGLQLKAILVTHHHWDHTNGIADLVAATGARVYGPAAEQAPIPCRSVAFSGGEHFEIPELGVSFETHHVPGHTLGAIAYHGHGLLFSGDTLFSAGCGRLFEGTPAMMHDSLSRLAALPGETRLCCGHEYTVANLTFAVAVEPGNRAVASQLERAKTLRARGEPTLPTTLAEEREANPFLRSAVPSVRDAAAARLGRAPQDEVEVFACLRQWKDGFRA